MIGNESVRGIIPSSFSACEGLSVRLGSKNRLSSAKTCKKKKKKREKKKRKEKSHLTHRCKNID